MEHMFADLITLCNGEYAHCTVRVVRHSQVGLEYSRRYNPARHVMFERYTERARRVIFFARTQASQLGSRSIESEHLLLGLVQEDRNIMNRFVGQFASVESIREEIAARSTLGEPTPSWIDLPL